MKYLLRKRDNDDIIVYESKKSLSFLYNNFLGRLFLKLFTKKFFSILVGKYMNSKLSKLKIKKYIKNNNINLNLYEEKNYANFNDFFIRKKKQEHLFVNYDNKVFISPCDSKLSVYKINKDLTLNIKNSFYSIDTLIENNIINEYINGYALVFRLSESDYHRYCYIDSGIQNENIHIKGIYHTVQKISLNSYNYYKTNNREYTILYTEHFGNVVEVEVGAMCIGKIKNLKSNNKFNKGEEKGYFEFGGSTIVLLVKEDIIELDNDILDNSASNIETIVSYGEKIGKVKSK